MLTCTWLLAAAVLCSSSSAVAVNLFVASYSGLVTTLSLTRAPDGSYELVDVSRHTPPASSPSSLTLDRRNRILYAIDEGLVTPNGSVTSFHTGPGGTLNQLDRVETVIGGVSAVIYGQHPSRAIAVAQ